MSIRRRPSFGWDRAPSVGHFRLKLRLLGIEAARLPKTVESNLLGRVDDDRGVEVAFESHLEQ